MKVAHLLTVRNHLIKGHKSLMAVVCLFVCLSHCRSTNDGTTIVRATGDISYSIKVLKVSKVKVI